MARITVSNKKESETAGNQALAEYNATGFTFTPSDLSYSGFLDFWFKEYCTMNLAQTTFLTYKKQIDYYIRPILGKRKISSITTPALQKYSNDMFNEGYSRNTLGNLKARLTGRFSFAVKLGYAKVNLLFQELYSILHMLQKKMQKDTAELIQNVHKKQILLVDILL